MKPRRCVLSVPLDCGFCSVERGEDLGLTDDQIAFYDALASNNSTVQAMGDDKLKLIAAELIPQVKKSVTID